MVFPRDEIPKRSILRLMTQKMPDYFTMQGAYTNAERRESIDNVFIAVMVWKQDGRTLLLGRLNRLNIYHDVYISFFLPVLLPSFFSTIPLLCHCSTTLWVKSYSCLGYRPRLLSFVCVVPVMRGILDLFSRL